MQQNCSLNSLHSCFCPTFDDMFFLLDALKFAIYWIFTVVCKALLSFIQPVFFMHLNFIYGLFPVALFSFRPCKNIFLILNGPNNVVYKLYFS